MRQLGLILLVAVFSFGAAGSDRPREPWEWTFEERVWARAEHRRSSNQIDGNKNPELIYPTHLFESKVRHVHSDRGGPPGRGLGQRSIDILTTVEEWERFKTITAPYAAALARQSEVLEAMARATAEERQAARPKMREFNRELCLLRRETLERVREEFGRVEFDRFLYLTGVSSVGFGRGGPGDPEAELAWERDCIPRPEVASSAASDRQPSTIPPPPPPPRPALWPSGSRPIDVRRCEMNESVILLDLGSGGYRVSTVEEGTATIVSPSSARSSWPVNAEQVALLVRRGETTVEPLTSGMRQLRLFDCDRDGAITSADCSWPDLALWFDRNRDGRPADSEVVSLDRAGVVWLGLSGEWIGIGDHDGNLKMNKGWFRYSDAGVERKRALFEFCLARDPSP